MSGLLTKICFMSELPSMIDWLSYMVTAGMLKFDFWSYAIGFIWNSKYYAMNWIEYRVCFKDSCILHVNFK